jgi:competence protein ComFC
MGREAGSPLLAGAAPGAAAFQGVLPWLRDSVVEPVLSVLFPPRCVGCGDFESYLCPRCEASLVSVGDDCCTRCGEPGPRPLVAGRCSHCMGVELAYAGARSAFRHAGAAKRMVVEFKSGGQPVLAPLMARLAAPAFRKLAGAAGAHGGAHGEDAAGTGSAVRAAVPTAAAARMAGPVVVTWVPSHPAAQRERGYNQAELLARALAGQGRPLAVAGLTRKAVRTRHQKALDRAGRQSNLRGAFVFDDRNWHSLPTRPGAIILVDDVYTTGATAHEVSSVLASGTGVPVYVFTFSRAVSRAGEGHD